MLATKFSGNFFVNLLGVWAVSIVFYILTCSVYSTPRSYFGGIKVLYHVSLFRTNNWILNLCLRYLHFVQQTLKNSAHSVFAYIVMSLKGRGRGHIVYSVYLISSNILSVTFPKKTIEQVFLKLLTHIL